MRFVGWFGLAFILVAGCSGETAQGGGEAMGTFWSVSYYCEADCPDDLVVIERMSARIDEMEQIFSTYRADSELSQFNQRPVGEWGLISTHLHEVLRLSAQIMEETGGAFNPSVGAAVIRGGFGPDIDPELVAGLPVIGRPSWETNDLSQGRRTVNVYLDLSAIAKGYAVDRAADLLEEFGITNYLIEIGGELVVRGTKQYQQPWNIAIEGSDRYQATVSTVLSIVAPDERIALATSGDYRNWVDTNDGDLVSHFIDPNTQRPQPIGSIGAVSVAHRQCAAADAYATALMVIGEPWFNTAVQLDLAARGIRRTSHGDQPEETRAWHRTFE